MKYIEGDGGGKTSRTNAFQLLILKINLSHYTVTKVTTQKMSFLQKRLAIQL